MNDKECPCQPKKFEDQQLQSLLDTDACQTQKQLAARLDIAQQTISDRLKMMGKILNEGIWVPYHLNERQMKNRKVVNQIILNAKYHGLIQASHHHPLQSQIALERRQCSAFGGFEKAWCIMSF